MKKKQILNICMVLTIVLIAFCGVMAVGSVKGWFGKNDQEASNLLVSEKTGIAMIERDGVAYEVSEGTAIQAEDKIYTKTAASLTIADAGSSRMFLGTNAEITFEETLKELKAEVNQGEALIDSRGMEQITIESRNAEVVLREAMATISTQEGSSMICLYSGEAVVHSETMEKETIVKAGNVATLAAGSSGCEVRKLSAASLSDSQIAQLLICGMDETFCFSASDLRKVQEEREAEILAAQQEVLKQKEEARKAALEEAKKKEEAAKKTASDDQTTASDTNTADLSTETVTEDYEMENEDLYEEGYEDSENYEDTESDENEEDSLSCTIKIVCDTIFDNMENLTPGKEGYVPSGGTILGTTSVTFTEGETVFEVLQRVCDSAGIQLEYSWTPMYDSYYIEGINHLYEFDCGSESGWMYKVNGWFPNYGCSSYELVDGDAIVWCYTCNELGADVGGGNF